MGHRSSRSQHALLLAKDRILHLGGKETDREVRVAIELDTKAADTKEEEAETQGAAAQVY